MSLFPGDEGWRELDELVEEIDPLGRMGTTDDIADVASFLVSKESDYMTGRSLNACGGLLID
ncbi:MAG: SDR family oxidoreductase [Thermoleophilia bacterium]|nr:SDR family oxidoreductase [Thermoleophilia bacterium]